MSETTGVNLTSREKNILAAKLADYDNRATAAFFGVSLSAVNSILSRAARKLGTKGQGSYITAKIAEAQNLVTQADVNRVRSLAGQNVAASDSAAQLGDPSQAGGQ